MDFDYIQVLGFNEKHQKVIRVVPWISIALFNPKDPTHIIDAYSLIDSGSDTTFFTSEIGEFLNYKTDEGKPALTYGVGGSSIKVFYHKVGVRIEDQNGKELPIEYEDFIGFTKSAFSTTLPQQTGILGSIGFFRQVAVNLDYPRLISITKKPKPDLN